ncbi:hypothetical protein TRICI_002820 [Trichomonascus ciferrii]|uniref:NAD+ kinase n=1 Tax=Trichomonascus ciferrii TaxID=44093 RepID=A0A642V5U3_9ASCO|nr:hypothetical protein TRICI_002820 [Trichomonascus ciferrii]
MASSEQLFFKAPERPSLSQLKMPTETNISTFDRTSSSSTLSSSYTGTPHVHNKFDDVLEGLDEITLERFPPYMRKMSHSKLVKTATGVRNLANQIGSSYIHMQAKAVLIVTKPRDNSLIPVTRELTEWLITTKGVTVYVDSKLQNSKRFGADEMKRRSPIIAQSLNYWTPEITRDKADMFDLVITLGGDGTVLYASGLFQKVVPPVLSFSLGSLGFLANYRMEEYKNQLNSVFYDGIKVNLRMRFSCSIHRANGELICQSQVLNDVVIDRGPNPWLSMLELYGNDSLLTVVQADGLILSTPTGSTAYSLSAGGALVHPEIPAMCITPICPHTLSFRPMLLPDSMNLKVCIPDDSRSTAWVSLDGRNRVELKHGDYLTVQASQYPFPTVISSTTEFIDSVSRSFHWNNTKKQKPFSKKNNDDDLDDAQNDEELFDIDFD